jgi:hypothetical protein
LLLRRIRAIHVVTAAIAAEGECEMTTLTTEEQTTLAATGTAQEPKATTKAKAARHTRHVAPSKGKAGKKASSPKRSAKGAQGAKLAKTEARTREGSKTAKILDLLKRAGGATTKELMKATGWQPHSVRGFLSGTVGKKMGLAVTSVKGEDGERSYYVKG